MQNVTDVTDVTVDTLDTQHWFVVELSADHKAVILGCTLEITRHLKKCTLGTVEPFSESQ